MWAFDFGSSYGFSSLLRVVLQLFSGPQGLRLLFNLFSLSLSLSLSVASPAGSCLRRESLRFLCNCFLYMFLLFSSESLGIVVIFLSGFSLAVLHFMFPPPPILPRLFFPFGVGRNSDGRPALYVIAISFVDLRFPDW